MLNCFTQEDLHEIVEALTTALDAKNPFMCGHSERVAELSLLLATGMGLSLAEQTRIHIGAHLHDVGKIGVPDMILNKSGKLTEAEFALIRQHPEIGDKIVGKVQVLQSVADIVRHHHERFDGNGYPDRLSGEKISLGARIVAVADAFDAMTSTRTYRPALSFNVTMNEMRRCRGSQFDPDVVDALITLAAKGKLLAGGTGLCQEIQEITVGF
ncbi:MAG TPA: HD-GYP domain-containing protein [Methylomusa anaerophila]|uniref:Cyclic di-GMP phosphodiesterase response regulator RpfG n=1 Tax=Methylomusa anaerophila TaxID=1930071 RepID=A0A348ANE9_9FIRM|nr:HD-GYP domain-containing protein [Methylomusa anaerophila]BBB92597.1 cyclic di-GMP phosphodiesterase response regulator RpfG [Methylomusa anaerophila]HML87549.1 HD-GYP domain-containing protein [Methylomusa anaerophila]